MQPGERNRIIIIQSRTKASTDSSGGPVYTWAKFATVWAKVSPLKGREMIAAQAAQSEVTTRFNIRWTTGVDSTMRIVYGGSNYDIISAIDIDDAHNEMQIMAKAVVSGA